MLRFRVILFLAGIAAVMPLPTTSFNSTAPVLTTAADVARRDAVLTPAPEQAKEDCGNLMFSRTYQTSDKNDLRCSFSVAHDYGMIIFWVLFFRYWLFEVYYTWGWPTSGGWGPKTGWSYMEGLWVAIYILGPVGWEFTGAGIIVYWIWNFKYLKDYWFPDSNTADPSRMDLSKGTEQKAQFNQGFPKIGAGDCRSTKYSKVRTSAGL